MTKRRREIDRSARAADVFRKATSFVAGGGAYRARSRRRVRGAGSRGFVDRAPRGSVGRTHVFLRLGAGDGVGEFDRLGDGHRGVRSRRAGGDDVQQVAMAREVVVQARHALAEGDVRLVLRGLGPRRGHRRVHGARGVRARGRREPARAAWWVRPKVRTRRSGVTNRAESASRRARSPAPRRASPGRRAHGKRTPRRRFFRPRGSPPSDPRAERDPRQACPRALAHARARTADPYSRGARGWKKDAVGARWGGPRLSFRIDVKDRSN